MPLHSRSEHTLTARNTSIFLLFFALLTASCAAVKKPPRDVPFVFDNKISVSGDMAGEQKKVLTETLYTYLDDSLQVPIRGILGFSQRVKPPVFDSGNVTRSITFMKGYLDALGYYSASVDTFTIKYDTIPARGPNKPRQIRTITKFDINLGKHLRVDTLFYAFDHPLLQHLADSAKQNAILLKNSDYSKDAMSGELDRLASLFRNNGFFKMSKSALIVEADTTDPSLISFDNDPIEQLLQAQKRRDDPRIKLKVMERPGVDSSVYAQYYIDSVFIYPEARINTEPEKMITDTTLRERTGRRSIIIREWEGEFKPKLLRHNNYLIPGKMYDDYAYFRTVNNYWRMGPWQQVDVKTYAHYDSLYRVNFHLFLYPSKRQNIQFDLEGSQNNNISVSNALAGRYFAIALNTTHRSRNVLKYGIQSTSSIRVGFEINSFRKDYPFFQSFIVSGNQNFSIPKLLWPFGFLDKKKLDGSRTQINFSALYSDRFNFYKQYSFTGNLEWEIRKGRNSYTLTAPNFESFYIVETDSLRRELEKNPSLRYAFTPGNILSIRTAWEHKFSFNRHPEKSGYFRLASELSPFYFSILNRPSFQFWRLEGQIVHNIQYSRSSLNFRAYAGVGWNFDKDSNGERATLPYYRQYIAGGSNSMRAWRLRQLGIGRSIVSDTAAGFNDRFGDIQGEVNAEYRFKLFRLFGFNFGGAAFTDIGNIWNHTNNVDGEGKFDFSDLYRDLAMDVGVGVRWDVSYLVIRFDMAYKLKDPVREGAGWVKTLEWKSYNRLGVVRNNNVGFQFGIGYPF